MTAKIRSCRKLFFVIISSLLFICVISIALKCILMSTNDYFIENFMAIKKITFLLRNILRKDDLILNDEEFEKIFFLESHQNSDRKFEDARQACSVESAARMNEKMAVYLIFVTNSSGLSIHYSDMIEALLSYSNIHLRFLNPIEFSKGTALEAFFKNDELKYSSYPIVHLSDVLRIMVLNKYGGQYFDLDVISLVPLSSIAYVNVLCPEFEDTLSNAIMNFDLKSGKKWTSYYMEKLAENIDFIELTGNGPMLLTKVAKHFCPSINYSWYDYNTCDNFTFSSGQKCFPFEYGEWNKLYEEDDRDEVLDILKNEEPNFIHFWNNMQKLENKTYKLPFTSKCAYVELAKKHCPRVFKKLNRYF